VSEWADAERMLTSDASAMPGRWRTSVTPHLREPMDRLSTSDLCERVVLMFGSQLGKTEAILNAIGYFACDSPANILMVQPRDEDVKRYMRLRVAPMIRGSAALEQRFAPPGSREGGASATMRELRGGGGALIMSSAQSPAALASLAARYVLLDEVDRYPASSGAEGDPVELAIQRSMTFSRRKIMMTSTPTIAGASRIAAEMEETGWREYHIPCASCGLSEPWRWEMMHWTPGRPGTAALHCSGCGVAIDESSKGSLLARGVWAPRHPERETGQAYGYHVTSLCAPYGWTAASWEALVRRWEASSAHPEKRKVFVNVALGLPFDDAQTSTVDPETLAGRAEDYPAPVPAGAAALTAGVDVQLDRLEASVYAWGEGEECWLVEHVVLPGDPTAPHVWADLDALLQRAWRHESGVDLRVAAACVDSGAWAQQVQAWCAQRRARRVWATKGGSDPARALWPRRASRGRDGRTVYVIGVSAAKDALWSRLQRSEPGPGRIHTPTGDRAPDAAWYDQIMSERRVVVAGGVRWERPRGARSEALDCWVYSYAALCSMGQTERTVARARRQLAAAPRSSLAERAQVGDTGGVSPSTTPPRPKSPPPPAPRRRPAPRLGSWLDPGARV